jgi:hypothetical protein
LNRAQTSCQCALAPVKQSLCNHRRTCPTHWRNRRRDAKCGPYLCKPEQKVETIRAHNPLEPSHQTAPKSGTTSIRGHCWSEIWRASVLERRSGFPT